MARLRLQQLYRDPLLALTYERLGRGVVGMLTQVRNQPDRDCRQLANIWLGLAF